MACHGRANDPHLYQRTAPTRRRGAPRPADVPQDLSWCTPGELAYYTIPPLFSNFSRYYGYIQLSDGSSRLQFVVKASAAYQACKESRGFLQFIFAETVKPGGGSPSWFRFDMDTIRFTNASLDTIARYPWFTQTQHLHIIILYEIYGYLRSQSEDDVDGKDHFWIEKNLLSLKNITFEMAFTRHGDLDSAIDSVCGEWFQVFEEWYNWSEVEKPVPYYARVLVHDNGSKEKEWLTPTNYLCVKKWYHQKHFQKCFPGPDWKDHITDERTRILVEATDEELGNPTAFFAKHSFWGLSQ